MHPMIRVWDLGVRVFHWSLAASFATAWFSSESRGDFHQWMGLAAAGLVLFRLLWGVAGPHYARFTQFVRNPFKILTYGFEILRGTEARYIGHNPAGGAMVMALILSISATAWTGWLMTTDAYFGEDFMQELHSGAATLTVVLVCAHLAGVIFASFRHRENLVRAMITGKKRAAADGDVP